MSEASEIQAFWQRYLDTLPEGAPERAGACAAEAFGNSPEMADELAALILRGTKTATCSALWEYEADGDPLPEAGHRYVLLDGQQRPLCVIETTEVQIRAYNEVDATFAAEEGEGDRTLDYWRRVHWRFFEQALARIGKEPTEDMPLVCERFRVVFTGAD